MFIALRRIATLLAVFVSVVFVVFVVNQTARAFELASAIHPTLGGAVLWGLIGLYVALLAGTLVLFLRMPPPLRPPEEGAGPQFEAHVEALRKRLASNPGLQGRKLATVSDVEDALEKIGADAEEVIRSAAATVFLSTAVSQSGRLDALLVLATHARLVWRVATLYYQRPTLRDMAFLYGNVAATAFVASELDDIDISEQVQPVLSSVFGGLASSVPGLQTVSTVLVQSTLTGSANAFLTLRVGLIARRYCGSLVRPERRGLRRSASAEAARFLGAIVAAGAKQLVKGVGAASKRTVGRRVSKLWPWGGEKRDGDDRDPGPEAVAEVESAGAGAELSPSAED